MQPDLRATQQHSPICRITISCREVAGRPGSVHVLIIMRRFAQTSGADPDYTRKSLKEFLGPVILPWREAMVAVASFATRKEGSRRRTPELDNAVALAPLPQQISTEVGYFLYIFAQIITRVIVYISILPKWGYPYARPRLLADQKPVNSGSMTPTHRQPHLNPYRGLMISRSGDVLDGRRL